MSKRILVLGANGMLGGSIFRFLSKISKYDVIGTVRAQATSEALARQGFANTVSGIDATDMNAVAGLTRDFAPHFLINCVGVIKQLDVSKAPIPAISLNSLLPHQLAELCAVIGCRLVHFSTDCVFLGDKGGYSEIDTPDANDLYGRSKLLGEVAYGPHLTLRTSIIGHEMSGHVSLVDWYLKQDDRVKGYSRAIFSGLPTVYVAQFLHDYVLDSRLSGLYNLSAAPIDKFTLLSMLKEQYQVKIDIDECNELQVDKSLSSRKLHAAVGFSPPPWDELISAMFGEYNEYFRGQ